jgi:hypothetical protein
MGRRRSRINSVIRRNDATLVRLMENAKRATEATTRAAVVVIKTITHNTVA